MTKKDPSIYNSDPLFSRNKTPNEIKDHYWGEFLRSADALGLYEPDVRETKLSMITHFWRWYINNKLDKE